MIAEVVEDYPASSRGELSLKKGDTIEHIRQYGDAGWYMGRDPYGKHGRFPGMFVEFMDIEKVKSVIE